MSETAIRRFFLEEAVDELDYGVKTASPHFFEVIGKNFHLKINDDVAVLMFVENGSKKVLELIKNDAKSADWDLIIQIAKKVLPREG